jgi:RNA polymerase sigma-70 factor (ECF subfamily)
VGIPVRSRRNRALTRARSGSLTDVSTDQLQPGDPVAFYSDKHHVGIYIEGGMMVNAPRTGTSSKSHRCSVIGTTRARYALGLGTRTPPPAINRTFNNATSRRTMCVDAPRPRPVESAFDTDICEPRRRWWTGSTGRVFGGMKDLGHDRTPNDVTDIASSDARRRFETVVETAYVPLQRYLRRRTNEATADDALGDVLLVMWRRVDDIPAGNALPWCYGVARGCLANALRSAERQQRLQMRLASVRPQGPLADHEALEEALGSLPDADRELLQLWAWEQLQPRDIARVLGMTPNAASIRLYRATRRLKQELTAGKKQSGHGQLHEREGTEAPR